MDRISDNLIFPAPYINEYTTFLVLSLSSSVTISTVFSSHIAANFLNTSPPSLIAERRWKSFDKCPKIRNSICSKSAARKQNPSVGIIGDQRFIVIQPMMSISPLGWACKFGDKEVIRPVAAATWSQIVNTLPILQ